MKRVFDFGIATIGLVLLSPVLAIVALLIRVNLGSPVLFTQTRPGYRGRPFRLSKFRTMTDERAPSGELLPDRDRITPLGQFLRSTSLDEIPELWAVAKGDMSLVGPRPLLTEYLPLYSREHARRHDVRPGITGWAQINGRNAISWEDRLALDVWYVDHRSMLLDLNILWRTIGRVFSRQGISAANEVTMPRFTGSARVGKS
jgi:lipopolysaccharide/colanic/teichoic acid biosynthesis glycosyltransferase